MRTAVATLAVPAQLVAEALPAGAPVDEQVLELDETPQVAAELGVAPAGPLPHLAPAEADLRALQVLAPAALRDQLVKQQDRRRVCGGSSSSERPRTSWARRLATSTSEGVTSM